MLLSIIILSYNRPEQVKRILENLSGLKSSHINLIVKDDCSPRQKEINEIVERYKPLLGFSLELYANSTNMGYDKNLLDAFYITKSKYIFLLSDDDYLNCEGVPSLIDQLSRSEYNIYFTPYSDKGSWNRKSVLKYSPERFHEVIYNSILFSGLIFNRQRVLDMDKDVEFLSNCIYTQVYLAVKIIFEDERFGVAPMNILYLGGDGENFFGKNESAKNKKILSDRESISANLNYQKFLYAVVEKISKETNLFVLTQFRKEYIKRLVAYALRARGVGFTEYLSFVKHCRSAAYINNLYLNVFFKVLLFIPGKIAIGIYLGSKKLLRRSG